ncbi:MAG TPA: DNA polymerase III subunit beta [Geminicoccus sp.]|jgi:DNA polymerase-3 subunit beta|uniref:DNA polymerase III subunit beta n=1 Tax=Geminicoccus sp. TaxID=2024832 RepID=UPI002E362232|nr:DNA polymerase III subunit beta [Geminicoccus sp.]HEX2529205.1 DNA polymerase III subunit beta [Geminicoccus sp.]
MKLTIERTPLLKSLGHVQSVVERRTTIPILSNVRLEAQNGELLLTATDMDLTLVSREEAEISESGTTTVAAHTLYEIVRRLAEGSIVELEQQNGTSDLQLRSGRSSFVLPALAADEFPAMSEEDLGVSFELSAGTLRKLFDKTRFAMSSEETRYYLNGVHLHATRGEGAAACLRAVATDGHRLARVEIPLPEGAKGIPPVIVPKKTVGEVRRLLEALDHESVVGVALSPSRIRFQIGTTVLVSRLIDGVFPDYERVIPQANEKVALIDARAFAVAIDRVATVATDKIRAVKLGFFEGRVVASAVSAEAGRAHDEVDCELTGSELEIGFNARYVLDITQQVEGNTIRLEMASPASPTLIRDPEDLATIYVLMPMRV